MKVLKTLISVGIVLFLLNSCDNSNPNFKEYLNQTSMEISPDDLHQFLKDSLDVQSKAFSVVHDEVYKSIGGLSKDSKAMNHLDSITKSKEAKTLYATTALHHFLKTKNLDYKEIKKEFSRLQVHEDKKSLEKKIDIVLSKVHYNNEAFTVGDTLNVPLKFDTSFVKKRLIFQTFASDSTYLYDGQIADVKTTLLEKNIYRKIETNYNDVIFKLRILEISDSNLYLGNRLLTVGDTFELSLFGYARKLN